MSVLTRQRGAGPMQDRGAVQDEQRGGGKAAQRPRAGAGKHHYTVRMTPCLGPPTLDVRCTVRMYEVHQLWLPRLAYVAYVLCGGHKQAGGAAARGDGGERKGPSKGPDEPEQGQEGNADAVRAPGDRQRVSLHRE